MFHDTLVIYTSCFMLYISLSRTPDFTIKTVITTSRTPDFTHKTVITTVTTLPETTSARAFSHQWTDLTSTQWHTAFSDLTSVGQISPHPNGTPQETKSDLANYAITMLQMYIQDQFSMAHWLNQPRKYGYEF